MQAVRGACLAPGQEGAVELKSTACHIHGLCSCWPCWYYCPLWSVSEWMGTYNKTRIEMKFFFRVQDPLHWRSRWEKPTVWASVKGEDQGQESGDPGKTNSTCFFSGATKQGRWEAWDWVLVRVFWNNWDLSVESSLPCFLRKLVLPIVILFWFMWTKKDYTWRSNILCVETTKGTSN